MSASDSPSVAGTFLVEVCDEDEGDGVVVWVVGEHDAANAKKLSSLLSSATKVSRGEVVIDLSRVTFLSAATLGIIVGSRNALSTQARGLTLRSPSRCATRLLDLCEIPYADETEPPAPSSQTALGSWVAVPSLTRSEPWHRSPTELPAGECGAEREQPTVAKGSVR